MFWGFCTRIIYVNDFTKSPFGRFYLSDYCLRPTCYSCHYRLESDADLRIGDFWGKEFSNDYLGTSLAVPLTERGLELIEKTPGLLFRSVPKSWTLDSQPRIKQRSLSMPADNALVLQKLRGGKTLGDIYRENLLWKYLVRDVKHLPCRLAGSLLPPKAKKTLRTVKRLFGG